MKYYTITWRTIDRNNIWPLPYADEHKTARSLTEVIAVEDVEGAIAIVKEWMDLPSEKDMNTPWEKVHNDVRMVYKDRMAFDMAMARYREAYKEFDEFSRDIRDGVLFRPGVFKTIDMRPYIHDPQNYSKYEIEIECLECDGNDITKVLDYED
jgi:hypothetical protein